MEQNYISMILKPLSLEEKTGFKNLSVIGGLDRYILAFLEKAVNAGELSSDIFSKMKKYAEIYSTGTPSERKKIIYFLKSQLTAQSAASAQTHSSPVPASASKPEKAEVIRQSAKEVIAKKITDRNRLKTSLSSDIQYAKGVGSGLGGRLKLLGLNTVSDLLTYLPRRYEDRSVLKHIVSLDDGEFETVFAEVAAKRDQKIRRNLTLTKITVTDGSGYLTLVWFNQPYRSKSMPIGTKLYASGKVERSLSTLQMSNPEIETEQENQSDNIHTARIVPIYPLTENLSQRTMRKVIKINLELYAHLFPELIPRQLIEKRGLSDYVWSLKTCHFPESTEDVEKAKKRLIYEELFFVQLGILHLRAQKDNITKNRTYNLEKNILSDFESTLPFKLTSAQKRTVKEILLDLADLSPMSRLVQGDVGSGKTIVAAFAVFAAVKSGFQAAVMAPTEILARQHYRKFKELLNPYGISVRLFTGSAGKRERRELHEELADGSIDVAVGTHALIQDEIDFKNLALVIVDEQHRFGVMQRTALQKKGSHPDMLVMTATPIPRTLSLTLYGDLSISAIDELPPGRKPIKSYFVQTDKSSGVYSFIKEEVKKGRQAYIVCSLIDESDKIEAKAAMTAAEELKNGIFSDLNVALMHGKMKSSEKDEIMENFREHRTDILISTTVIEVGVDVPNATIMVILNSERFGLAQLHQLRGRIGRGALESSCFFIADAKSQEARTRMKTMVESSDGFLIAEKDLEIRGPGDFCGTRQHGLPELRAADLVRDRYVMEDAREDAAYVLANYPDFINNEQVKEKLNVLNVNPSELIH